MKVIHSFLIKRRKTQKLKCLMKNSHTVTLRQKDIVYSIHTFPILSLPMCLL